MVIGMTVPAPSRLNNGSSGLSNLLLKPVVICETVASSFADPWKLIAPVRNP